jgi:hypothetical protein
MEASIGQNSSSPTGHVRVGTVVSLGLLLVSCLPLLIARYPGLSIADSNDAVRSYRTEGVHLF